MPKQYSRKYRQKWETAPWATGWLTKAGENSLQEAYCKLCKVSIRAHQGDLKKHRNSATHQKNAKAVPEANKITSHVVQITNDQKVKDITLAYYTAMHSSVRSVDHLCEVINNVVLERNSEKFKLHRTKCSCLIKNVIAPTLYSNLIEDLKGKKYSIIVDESTDISVVKYLCVCVKFFSSERRTIVVDFLGLIVVESVSANALYDYVTQFLDTAGLQLENLVGIGTDGANNLCGKRHSLFSLLKEKNPKIQLVRCICHSINLAASNASEELPAHIDLMCKEIYNWFSCSSQRQLEYKRLFDILNNSEKKFHKFIQLSSTRWLCRYYVINTILEHYEELQVHFSTVVAKEKCYSARLLNEMLSDNSNYLFFLILRPILHETNNINVLFQKSNVNLGRAYQDLVCYIKFLSRKVIKPVFVNSGFKVLMDNINNNLAYLDSSECDFGIDYFTKSAKLKCSAEKKVNIEQKAFNYLQKLIKELVKRLPDNLDFFDKMASFSPDVVLSPLTRCKCNDLPFFLIFVNPEDMCLLEVQYNKLMDVNWTGILDKETLKDTHLFWAAVYYFSDASESRSFEGLASFVLTVLSMPTSNAVVERVFSIMNAIKSKLKNRMQTEMLSSLLTIRVRSYRDGQCCNQFVPSNKMLKLFNSDIYTKTQGQYPTNCIANIDDCEIVDALEGFDVPCLSL